MIALAVMGIGQFFDGWFRLDCRAIDAGCSGGGTGWQVAAHEIESLFTVLGLLVSVFALARAFKKAERWRDLRMPSLIAGFATDRRSSLVSCSWAADSRFVWRRPRRSRRDRRR